MLLTLTGPISHQICQPHQIFMWQPNINQKKIWLNSCNVFAATEKIG